MSCFHTHIRVHIRIKKGCTTTEKEIGNKRGKTVLEPLLSGCARWMKPGAGKGQVKCASVACGGPGSDVFQSCLHFSTFLWYTSGVFVAVASHGQVVSLSQESPVVALALAGKCREAATAPRSVQADLSSYSRDLRHPSPS